MKVTTTLIGSLLLVVFASAVPSQLTAQNAPGFLQPDNGFPTEKRQGESPPALLWNLLSPSPNLFPGSASVAASSEVNSVVRTLTTSGSDLYAAGDFIIAGNNVVNYVARWNGSAWSPLGDFPQGLDGPATTLAVDGENVYVGGNFTQAGAVRSRNIAQWNKTTNTWTSLAGGVGGALRNGVSAIAVHNGNIFVGGSFIAAGKTVAANIARWDGQRWYRVGTGLNDDVNALLIDGDYLYAGGDFTIAGDVPARGIARYNLITNAWENIGVDIEGSVNAIASDSRYLYIGGVFDTVAGQLVNNIIRIDKQSGAWSPLYKGLPSYSYVYGGSTRVDGIEMIVVRGEYVYVGGTLTQAAIPSGTGEEMLNMSGVVRWDGTTWSNLNPTGNGIHGVIKNAPAPANVYALAFYNGDSLVIGGDFDTFRNFGASPQQPSPYLCILDPENRYQAFGVSSANKETWSPPSTTIVAADDDGLLHNAEQELFRNNSRRMLLQSEDGAATGRHSLASNGVADDIYWQSVGPDATTDNGVLALAADNNEVYAGGTFLNIFGIRANGIAVRRNKEWFPLDDGTMPGVDGFVFAIALSGSKVYVAGQFSKAGAVNANNIAVWDRTTHTWAALGNGITGDGSAPAFVSEILVNGNDIYVAGNFTTAGGSPAKSIARWRDGAWSALGDGIDGTVNALEMFRGNLYAGGSFSKAGAVTSSGVAYWDGSAWRAMQSGVSGYVNDLEVYYSSPGDTNLVIGGEFTIRVDTLYSYYGIADSRGRIVNVRQVLYTGADVGRSIVLWNGSGWRLYQSESEDEGSGCFSSAPIRMKDGVVRRLVADGQDLYVCGSFDDAFPRGSGSTANPLNNISFFNRTVFNSFVLPLWHPVKGGVNANASALAVTRNEIIVGGDFTRAANGTMEADHIAIWDKDEQDWIWAGNPTALAPVEALAFHNNSLFAAGSFTTQEVGLFDIDNHIVRLSQLGWRTIDGVMKGTPFVLTSAPGDELISGGTILSSDQKISINVARWNAASEEWNPLTPGSGVASLDDISFVSAVAANDNNIFVGGDFDIADTLLARNVARWDRAQQAWHAMADGFNGIVYALALGDDGTLFAAGNFTRSGSTPLNRVARWDGSAWQPLGDGLNGNVFALTFNDGTLYAGGRFDSAGGAPARNVARWDVASQQWTPLGDGLNASFDPYISALTVINGQLFAAGKFNRSGLDTMNNIARWNPRGWWMPLGSGTDQLINSLAGDEGSGSLYVGGHFLSAGSKSSRYVGRWTNVTLSIAAESTGAEQMLGSGVPNPFTSGASVRVSVPEGNAHSVRLELFDAMGRRVRTLVDGSLTSGDHRFDVVGEDLAAGAYVLRLQAGEKVESVKLVKW